LDTHKYPKLALDNWPQFAATVTSVQIVYNIAAAASLLPTATTTCPWKHKGEALPQPEAPPSVTVAGKVTV